MQGVADPQVAGVGGQERPPLGGGAAQGPGGGPLGRQQPVHGRAMQLARADDPRPLEHPDDPADGAPGSLALDAQDVLGDLGGDRSAPAPVLAISWKECLEAPAAVGVVPGLDRARRKLHPRAVWPLVRAPRRLGEVPPAVPVLQSCTGQRPKHPQPPQGHRLLVIVLHGLCCSRPPRPFLGGLSASPAAIPGGVAKRRGYMRRTLG